MRQIEQHIGATADLTSMRHDGVELGERVVEWDEGSGYVLETTKVVKVPMRSNRIAFRVEPHAGETIVRETMEYSMKGGFLATVLERLAAGRMEAAMAGNLSGLKTYVEAGAGQGTAG